MYHLALLLLLSISFSTLAQTMYTGQGIMAGEVTAHSAILQTRLTASDTLINNELPGIDGLACFEVDTDSSFSNSFRTAWQPARPDYDHIVKIQVSGLHPNRRYYYRARYGPNSTASNTSPLGTFRTLADTARVDSVSLVVVTGMNYRRFHYGRENRDSTAYQGADKALGYPALATITQMQPDFFVGTGDNVYYDQPPPGQDTAVTEPTMRQHWHWQFSQPRYHQLFAQVPTYWEKDDHDYRWNDADTVSAKGASHATGIKIFNEQVPVVNPNELNPVTYRTHRLSRDLQIWLVENRDYRSPNLSPDTTTKTIWGREQREWLQRTLLDSDATYKILISPTPMVGPDDAYKKDNHTNPGGFRYERDQFFEWLNEHDLLSQNFYVICGDRHWQYHARHPSGVEEFSTGALVDGNSRLGRKAGDPNSTDPAGLIEQPYLQPEASGGFLQLTVAAPSEEATATASFTFYDENGVVLYEHQKEAR